MRACVRVRMCVRACVRVRVRVRVCVCVDENHMPTIETAWPLQALQRHDLEDKLQKGQGEPASTIKDSDQASSPNSVSFPPFHAVHT